MPRVQRATSHPPEKTHGLHFIINHSPVFKCAAQKSFHEIISCQYGKPVAYILKFKPGHAAATWQACSEESPAELSVEMVAQKLQHEYSI